MTRSSLFDIPNRPGNNKNPGGDPFMGDDFDVEAAREKLEALVGSTSAGNSATGAEESSSPTGMMLLSRKNDQSRLLDDEVDYDHYDGASSSYVYCRDIDVTLPKPPPLTAIERERRQAEIELLSQLDEGDDVLPDIWRFWFHERGSKAAAKLFQAEKLVEQNEIEQAETILTNLIEEHGAYWAEPVNRLATLYFTQGKYEDAEILCKMVLAVKPWHFGALSGIVMVYAAMQDPISARQWAARRLPTFAAVGANRRRLAWVAKAVEDARQSLLEAEGRVRESFGRPDQHTKKSNKHPLADDEEDAWQ